MSLIVLQHLSLVGLQMRSKTSRFIHMAASVVF